MQELRGAIDAGLNHDGPEADEHPIGPEADDHLLGPEGLQRIAVNVILFVADHLPHGPGGHGEQALAVARRIDAQQRQEVE